MNERIKELAREAADYNVEFHIDGRRIGRLDFNSGVMVFEGDAEESAKVFFDALAEKFADRLKEEREKEREACAAIYAQFYWDAHAQGWQAQKKAEVEAAVMAEREACAQLVDHILCEGGGTYGDAIRARGEKE
jgi:hypothetical protein